MFLIVRFVKLNRTYLLFGEDFVDYIDHHDRASIPLSYFEQRGHLILDQYHPRVDYLKVIDQIYGGANESELQKNYKKSSNQNNEEKKKVTVKGSSKSYMKKPDPNVIKKKRS